VRGRDAPRATLFRQDRADPANISNSKLIAPTCQFGPSDNAAYEVVKECGIPHIVNIRAQLIEY
jgi:hypothetical protein